jgi:hypothetical protein
MAKDSSMDLDPITHSKRRIIVAVGGSANYWDTVKRFGHSCPEQDLMLAVLKDGLVNYRRRLVSPNRKTCDDREWFFGVENKRLFSFESICAVLGLSAQRIRKRLLDWENESRTRWRTKARVHTNSIKISSQSRADQPVCQVRPSSRPIEPKPTFRVGRMLRDSNVIDFQAEHGICP